MSTAAPSQRLFYAGPPDRTRIEKAALRTRSTALRDVLARLATRDRLDYPATVAAAREDALRADTAWPWLAGLARVVALQDSQPADLSESVALFAATPEAHLDSQAKATLPRLLLRVGAHDEARRFIERHPTTVEDAGFVRANMVHPELSDGDGTEWEQRLTRALAEAGLDRTRLAPGPEAPFDRLTADIPAGTAGGQLVTVVMTAFRPTAGLLTSVRSITAQTWADLEVLIVDDESGPEYAPVFEQAAALDERVRVLRAERNGGTYRARNIALREATGVFVTGQDDDDWAHPRRIESQVRPLLADEGLPATLSRAVWASDELEVSPLGWPAIGNYAPSYLARLELLSRAGGYVEARKAADTELIRRVEAMTGRETYQLAHALSVYRTRPGSLSRADYAPGWSHPARVAFRQLSDRVHQQVRQHTLDATDVAANLEVPDRFRVTARPRQLDAVFLADWRRPAGHACHPALREVRALADKGHRVAIAHLEDLRTGDTRAGLDPLVLSEVNSGLLDLVFLDDRIETASLLVYSAGLLQLAAETPMSLQTRSTVLLADEGPWTVPGDRATFDVTRCEGVAQTLTGTLPRWLPRNPAIREKLREVVAPGRLTEVDYLGVADTSLLSVARPGALHGSVVAGAFDVDERSAATLAPLLPHGLFDVRTLGRAVRLPDWVAYRRGELAVADYVTQIDFLYALDPVARQGWGDLADALAAGCIVVLPPDARGAFGDAAIPGDAATSAQHCQDLIARPADYRSQVERARDHVRSHLTPEALVERLVAAEVLPPSASWQRCDGVLHTVAERGLRHDGTTRVGQGSRSRDRTPRCQAGAAAEEDRSAGT